PFTRDDGLPSDHIQSLAFGKSEAKAATTFGKVPDTLGMLFAGTQCDGVAISDPPKPPPKEQKKTESEGVNTRSVTPRTCRQVAGCDSLPLVPSGPGLPTNLINQVPVTRDGTIFVATTTGLVASKDHGKTFTFIRGADWSDKVKGLY